MPSNETPKELVARVSKLWNVPDAKLNLKRLYDSVPALVIRLKGACRLLGEIANGKCRWSYDETCVGIEEDQDVCERCKARSFLNGDGKEA